MRVRVSCSETSHIILIQLVVHSFAAHGKYYTGWPKSNVPKVRAYCLASDHLIRKVSSEVCGDFHWFEEYLKIMEIDYHFYE